MDFLIKHLFIHFSVLLIFKSQLTTYECLSLITERKDIHLLHTISLIVLLYLISNKIVSYFLIRLTNEEETNVKENLLYYLTDVILIISVFTSSFSIINFLEFVFIINFKIINWIIDIRSKNTNESKIIVLLILLLIVILPSNIITFIYSIEYPSIQILFSYELFLLIISISKNISYVSLNKHINNLEKKETNEEIIEDRKLICNIIIEFSYLISKLTTILIFFIYTTIKLRLPFNVLREFIKGISILVSKLRNWYKLITLIKLINKCKIVQGTCPICREEMDLGREMSCGHAFHSICIKKWAEKQMQCPVCRKDIISKNIGVPVQIVQ